MPAFDVSNIDVEDFLECLEIRNVRRATEKEFCFSCPYPSHSTGDETPSAYMNAETTAFMCHSCHARGNAVSFTSDILEVSPIEATRMLRQRYAPGGIDPDSRDMVAEIKKIIAQRIPPKRAVNRILDESVLDEYRVNWTDIWDGYQHHHRSLVDFAEYMIVKRGFSPNVLDDWQFGFDNRTKRITLPVRDEKGNLVGVKARAMDGRKPKYLNFRDQTNDVTSFLKNEVVFGLDRARNNDPDYDLTHMIVVEGEFNVVAMHARNHTHCVSINGSYFGERQMQLLRLYADSVTLFFDTDTAGKDATQAVARELHPFMQVFICPDHWGDPAEMDKQSISACINDRISYTSWRIAAIS